MAQEGTTTMSTAAEDGEAQRKRRRENEKSSREIRNFEDDEEIDRERRHRRGGRSFDEDYGIRSRTERSRRRISSSRSPDRRRHHHYYHRSTYDPRSRSDFKAVQHNSTHHSAAGHCDRTVLHKGSEHGSRSNDPKDKKADTDVNKVNKHQSKDKSKDLLESEGTALPSSRRRRPFREKKMQPEDVVVDIVGIDSDSIKPPTSSHHERKPGVNSSDKREVQRSHNRQFYGPLSSSRYDRQFHGSWGRSDPDFKRGDAWVPRYGDQSRERNGVRHGQPGNHSERYNGMNSSFKVEKWKHDLFEEANKSPNQKNEEEQIAKVEALLSM